MLTFPNHLLCFPFKTCVTLRGKKPINGLAANTDPTTLEKCTPESKYEGSVWQYYFASVEAAKQYCKLYTQNAFPDLLLSRSVEYSIP